MVVVSILSTPALSVTICSTEKSAPGNVHKFCCAQILLHDQTSSCFDRSRHNYACTNSVVKMENACKGSKPILATITFVLVTLFLRDTGKENLYSSLRSLSIHEPSWYISPRYGSTISPGLYCRPANRHNPFPCTNRTENELDGQAPSCSCRLRQNVPSAQSGGHSRWLRKLEHASLLKHAPSGSFVQLHFRRTEFRYGAGQCHWLSSMIRHPAFHERRCDAMALGGQICCSFNFCAGALHCHHQGSSY